MKSLFSITRLKSLVVLVLCTMTFSIFAQAIPEIETRFTNPDYNRATRTYALDVELKSKMEPEKLFGMNFRFYYDASMVVFGGIDQFHQGYGILGDTPKGIVGTENSGQQLFGFEKAAGFVNSAVILVNEFHPLDIQTDKWEKLCRVTFKVPVTANNKENFCPSVIWDLEKDPVNGGFLPGAGLVITVVERKRNSRFESAPARPVPQPFNWEYNGSSSMPFGNVVSQECIPVGTTTTTEEQDKTHAGYELFQNNPNPFDGQTTIDFILPSAQEATIVLYDVDGAVKETIEGSYKAGRNQITLKKKPWMVETSVVYYRLVTKNHKSRTIAMTLVRA